MSEIRGRRERPAWLNTALIVVASLVIGFFVLPRIRPGASRLVGKDAPDFALPVIHGGDAGSRIRLLDLRGRVVVLDFWASWCPSCRKQIPALESLARASRPEQTQVVGVNTADEPGQGTAYAQSRNLGYPVVLDEGERVARDYEVTTLPLLVVVGPTGRVTAVRQSVVSESELRRLVEAAR